MTDKEEIASILKDLLRKDLSIEDSVFDTLEVIQRLEARICAIEIRADDSVHYPNEDDL